MVSEFFLSEIKNISNFFRAFFISFDEIFKIADMTFKNALSGLRQFLGTENYEDGVTRKRSTKRLKHTENLFRKNLQLKDVC